MSILREFKTNLVAFLDELIESFPSEGHFVVCRIFVKDKFPIETIMKHFITDVIPYKKSIKERDESFFIEQGLPIFKQAGDDLVNHFKTLWKSSAITADNKEVIWDWMNTFVLLAEKWQELRKAEC
jgi:hypothetical protein